MSSSVVFKTLILFAFIFSSQSAYSEKNSQESSPKCRIEEAKKIITDVLPGEENKAEKILINCIRLNPNDLTAILALAQLIEQGVYLQEKSIFDIHKSLALISQAYTLAPNDPKVRYTMVHILGTLGQYEEAQALYEKTMKEFPSSKETLIEKAKLVMEKNPDESLSYLFESIKMGTDIDDVTELIISSIRSQKNDSSYTKKLNFVAEKYQNRWLYHELGRAYLEEKKYSQAAFAFSKAIELGNIIESKLQLAILQYEHLNDYENSIENFENLINEFIHNKDISNKSIALVYSHYSLALLLNKEIQNASQAALLVEKNSYGNHDYLNALVYEFKMRHALAVLRPTLELAIFNDPTFDFAYAYLAEIKKDEKNYNLALENINKAIILNPKNDYFYELRGSVYYKLLDYKTALINFDKALELNPGIPIYYYNKACILALLGNKKDSLYFLKLVLNKDIGFVELAKNDPDFNSIKSDILFSKEFASLVFENYNNKWVTREKDFKSLP